MADLGRWNYLIGFGLIFVGLAVAAHPSHPARPRPRRGGRDARLLPDRAGLDRRVLRHRPTDPVPLMKRPRPVQPGGRHRLHGRRLRLRHPLGVTRSARCAELHRADFTQAVHTRCGRITPLKFCPQGLSPVWTVTLARGRVQAEHRGADDDTPPPATHASSPKRRRTCQARAVLARRVDDDAADQRPADQAAEVALPGDEPLTMKVMTKLSPIQISSCRTSAAHLERDHQQRRPSARRSRPRRRASGRAASASQQHRRRCRRAPRPGRARGTAPGRAPARAAGRGSTAPSMLKPMCQTSTWVNIEVTSCQ